MYRCVNVWTVGSESETLLERVMSGTPCVRCELAFDVCVCVCVYSREITENCESENGCPMRCSSFVVGYIGEYVHK